MIQALDRGGAIRVLPGNTFNEKRTKMLVDHLRYKVLVGHGKREVFHVIFLTNNMSFIDEMTVDSENSSELSLRMRDLFSKALLVGSRIMILAHNHPSGDCRPSSTDIKTTARIRSLALALDIDLADHLIFTTKSVYSMRAGGNL